MNRLIYVTADNSYNTFDSESSEELVAKEELLQRQGFDVLCLVDYENRFISKKSPDYSDHRDHIDDIIFDPRFVSNY